ncbi:hypothetical protein BGZ79_002062 [Entomortierella chlamydospora]|nr:hypothetical protein BGZ79_002062 [Entomortierella chlamydospora]
MPPYSIGVAEASPTYQDDYETKFMKDKKKITRELHDLLRCRLDDIPPSTRASEFAVVGFMVSGPVLRTMYMSNPGGYVSRLVHHRETYTIASVPAQFPKNLKILHHLLSVKELLVRSKSIIDNIANGDISSGQDSESEPFSSSALPPRTQPSDQVKRTHIPKQQDSPDRAAKRKLQKPHIPRMAMKSRTTPSRDDFAHAPPTGTLHSPSPYDGHNSTQVTPVQAARNQRQKDGEGSVVSYLRNSKNIEDAEHHYKKPMESDTGKAAYSDSESYDDEYNKYEGEDEEAELEEVKMVEVAKRRGVIKDLSKKFAPSGSRKL